MSARDRGRRKGPGRGRRPSTGGWRRPAARPAQALRTPSVGGGPHGTPSCRHFGTCGGCTLLDVPIVEQVRRKHDRVAALLEPFLPAGVGLSAAVPRPAPPRHDRTKLLYPAAPGRARGGALALGLYAHGTHELVPIRDCEIQVPYLTRWARSAEDVLRAAGLEPYDEAAPEAPGVRVRAVSARLASGTGEVMLGLTTTGGADERIAPAAEGLWQAALDLAGRPGRRGPRPVGLVRSILDGPSNRLIGRRHVPLRGRDHQFDHADRLWFRISFGSFYQVHRDADRILYAPALRACGDVRGRRVVDAYGGVGTFALRLLAHGGAAHVTLLEDSASACADAGASAARNGLAAERLDVRPGPVPADGSVYADADLVVLDPPRSGLGEDVAAALADACPPRIVYVACSPEALARDLGTLVGPYRVRSAELVDLFPHTPHAEVVVALERTGVPATGGRAC